MSRIGELSVFARRSGDMWMLSVMNGGPAKKIDVPLSFKDDGEYNASLVRDNKTNSGSVVVEKNVVESDETLTIDMLSGGGFVGRFTK